MIKALYYCYWFVMFSSVEKAYGEQCDSTAIDAICSSSCLCPEKYESEKDGNDCVTNGFSVRFIPLISQIFQAGKFF